MYWERKNWNHIDINIQTLQTQYLVEAPLAAITAMIVIGYDTSSFAQALSGWKGTACGQPVSGLSRDVRLGLRQASGWATQFTQLTLSHSCVVLTTCIGAIDLLEGDLRPSLSALEPASQLGYLCPLHHSTFPQPWPVPSTQSRPLTNTPTTWSWPPPCFTTGMTPGRCWVVPAFLQTSASSWGQTVQSWFHQTRETCFSVWVFCRCLFAHSTTWLH